MNHRATIRRPIGLQASLTRVLFYSFVNSSQSWSNVRFAHRRLRLTECQYQRTPFYELNLNKTYVCKEGNNVYFVPIRYKSKELNIPLFLNSTKNEIISTARDQMVFIKKIFSGYFFPKSRFNELYKWNSIFFPFRYGIGLQKFNMPRILSPIHPVPEMLGHCGSVGSVAFHIPDRNLYITGTINQQSRPNVAFQTMIKMINFLQWYKWKRETMDRYRSF